MEPKTFRQRRPTTDAGWEWTVKGLRKIPYRLPELLAEPTRPVVVVEGEKDVDNLARLGVLATCNAGGAGKWTAEHAQFLKDRRVVIFADNDDVGRKHGVQVAQSLVGIASQIAIVELPDLPEKGDVSDWIAAGGTKEQLFELVKGTPLWTPGSETWPGLEPLDDSLLPSFPTDALPDKLRQWVREESRATQTPEDLAALLSLAVCSACIARRVEVEPRPGFREPVNLYVAVALDPANRKSRVFADAVRPLRDLEKELIEAAGPALARSQSERRQLEGRLRGLEKAAANDSDARQQALDLAAELAERKEPATPRLVVDDATSEKLGMILADQNGRIASMSPEGGVFDLMAGMYAKSGLPQFGLYLMGHSGDDLITDRVGRETVCVSRPALTCAYTIQVEVMKSLAENKAFRGRGLLARFLYAAPQSWIGHRAVATPPVSEATKRAYDHALRQMADGVKMSEPFVLRLSDDAGEELEAWEHAVEDMLAEGGALEMIRDWGGKLVGATLRLAAVLHCFEHGLTGSIDRQTIQAAIRIASYLTPHAEAVLQRIAVKKEPHVEGAEYVLRWIERHGRRTFTKREAQQHGKRRFPEANDIDAALAELRKRNYIRLVPPAPQLGPGRPPSDRYQVNPDVFASRIAPGRSQYSQNSLDGAMSGDSENIESAPFDLDDAADQADWGEV